MELPILEDRDFVELPADFMSALIVVQEIEEFPVEVYDRWDLDPGSRRCVLKSDEDARQLVVKMLGEEGQHGLDPGLPLPQ